MRFLTDEESNALTIKRMIFNVVGGELEIPVLVSEISSSEHVDFFLERIKSALSGNLFRFTELSSTERILRLNPYARTLELATHGFQRYSRQ
ncbi:hypothetical protein GT614_03285 [Enterobacter hormaechei]|uniref:hypothetical protein n=1 Tax=Enterobacter hormaechei TaxID=158836 RepID=UPI001370B8FC|nr:hypothetical protein [Enterobacter hormaechei]MCC4570346.1 hypothetical protein [Enterobacter hormaechei subsp. hoffmannii]MCC4573544.1 hypothetical protein [Enterobacter hormaechei subsp. hoffmannii]MCC4578090.1 hypothetical protein [Enterobacter hormaechei subsp. hoffmannii]MCC4583982.1 hypothetical protein [Enterobacter hormaechei subsp. hoffmannii]MZJ51823.1 hypothetical protein [Enterobacter hormaechei]